MATLKNRSNRSTSADRGADGQTGHRAERFARPTRTGRRGLQGPEGECCRPRQRVDRNSIYIDLGGNAEGFVAREQMVPREQSAAGSHQSAADQGAFRATRSATVHDPYVAEVPDRGVRDGGTPNSSGSDRDPGAGAPIRAARQDRPCAQRRSHRRRRCLCGVRRSRMQVVSDELHSEHIDIFLYDDDPAQFVVDAMSPPKIVSIVVDEAPAASISPSRTGRWPWRGGRSWPGRLGSTRSN